MALTAIVRVSFQTNAKANNAARTALTKDGVFEKIGTQLFVATKKPNAAVGAALAALAEVVARESATLDYMALSLGAEKPAKKHSARKKR